MRLISFRTGLRALGRLAVLCILCGGIAACSDDNKSVQTVVTDPFDPSKPVAVTGFVPESGGFQEQIIVKGQNFGNDKSKVRLRIGGKDAVLINVQSDKLYGIVPAQAFSGEVEVIVTDDQGNEHAAVCSKNFAYISQKVVGTLCGWRNENDNQGEIMGPFETCCGFSSEGTLAFDPLYPTRLYICYDGSNKIQLLDLESRETSILMSANRFGNKRLRNLAFTADGKYMLVSTDRDDNGLHSNSVWIVTRSGDGTFNERSSVQPLASYKQCNTVAVHPVNGEVYFNSYNQGQLFRLDLNDYFNSQIPDPETGEIKSWSGYMEDGAFQELFKIQDPSYEFTFHIHPSGNYAYIVVVNRDYILRTDYNWEKKEFTTPYVIVGSNGAPDWVDAVGTNARVHRPYQGVFVKNPEYEADGRDDIYDFYFADCLNFCIRYITPEGMVRTYAGRAPSTNGNIWGTEDGALRTVARFRDVTGIAYDQDQDIFYVLDHNNRSVRTIGSEDKSTQRPSTPDDGDEEGDSDDTTDEQANS